VDLFPTDKDNKVFYEKPNERWEYAVTISPTHSFQQISFVNGVCTYKGGKHIDYLVGKITREVSKYIETKKKVKVPCGTIKEQLFVFLKCDIISPTFDSQTKECLNTPVDLFGSSFQCSETFIEKIAKSVVDLVCNLTKAREDSKIAKTTDGKRGRILHIDKYSPANWAGTSKSKDCILILCEGDSAKSGIVSGLSQQDRDIIGIYPLRGKLLNVRGEDATTIGKNKEITELKQILGLENGREYTTLADVHKHLNYSHVMILCDADVDGSHIKGLCINLFDCEWSSLLHIPGFLCYMNTPILRATKGNQTLLFYNEGEFQLWKTNRQNEINSWKIKYYKGLGTSTNKEFKEYFVDKKYVNFEWTDNSHALIDMAFNKKMADVRKQWLENSERNVFLDTSLSRITYSDFIQKELIQFCRYSCERAIPNVMDGLKTSQRKILYSAFKRNLTQEIKVAQFAGYVSEHSNYHHGEASLCGTIIHMAQNYMGSNNINLLMPNGQFGTRIGKDGTPGDDHASPRYIFTQLSTITRFIFKKEDDAILNYLEDDGDPIEPEYYSPIIPLLLVNGTQGIGMGYSTEVVCYSPKNIIEYLIRRLNGDGDNDENNNEKTDTSQWIPYYEGFQGSIERTAKPGKFLVRGVYEIIAEDTVRITELPVGMATSKLMSLLKILVEPTKNKQNNVIGPALIKDYRENNTDTVVNVVVEFPKNTLTSLISLMDENKINGLEKCLKLTTTLTTSNMYLFDSQLRLRKYETIDDILNEFYNVRLITLEKRRRKMIDELEQELILLTNKATYILKTLNGEIDLRNKTSQEIINLLKTYNFVQIPDYDYLLRLRMDSVSKEKVAKIMEERDQTNLILCQLKETRVEKIWVSELETLQAEYEVLYLKNETPVSTTTKTTIKTKKVRVNKV
jgi:DNA topoisomerase-2